LLGGEGGKGRRKRKVVLILALREFNLPYGNLRGSAREESHTNGKRQDSVGVRKKGQKERGGLIRGKEEGTQKVSLEHEKY